MRANKLETAAVQSHWLVWPHHDSVFHVHVYMILCGLSLLTYTISGFIIIEDVEGHPEGRVYTHITTLRILVHILTWCYSGTTAHCV